jgi:hypothetical protein
MNVNDAPEMAGLRVRYVKGQIKKPALVKHVPDQEDLLPNISAITMQNRMNIKKTGLGRFF